MNFFIAALERLKCSNVRQRSGHNADSECYRNGWNEKRTELCDTQVCAVTSRAHFILLTIVARCLLDPWHWLLQFTSYCVKHLALWGRVKQGLIARKVETERQWKLRRNVSQTQQKINGRISTISLRELNTRLLLKRLCLSNLICDGI